MRTPITTWAGAATLLTAGLIPGRLAAQGQPTIQQKEEHHRYKLVELGTFGGPNSYFTFIFRSLNRHGVATGTADTPVAVNPPFCLVDCFLAHAFLWNDGVINDLGALPGVGASFPSDINTKGVVTGLSLNGGTDPVLGLPFFDAVVWKNGQILDLGTFGGALSYPGAINDHAEVVGFALNTTPDSFDLGDFCQNFQMPTQMRAFIWNAGALQDLGTLGGTDSCALFVNDRGQAAGNSFTNSIVSATTGLPTLHPFLWDDDKMLDLGTLGGTIAVANGINNKGQIAGVSRLSGDQIDHAFLWDNGKLNDFGTLGGMRVEVIGFDEAGELVGKADVPGSLTYHAFFAKNGVMTDLGTQDGDPCSDAISINENNQIVGFSEDCSGDFSGNIGHAFLWENGHMTDLNAFVPMGSSLTLTVATFINDRGEIAVEGVLPNGDLRAVLLIPCDRDDADTQGCQDTSEGTTTATRNDLASVTPASPSITQGRLTSEMSAAWRARSRRRYRGFGTWPRE